MTSSQYGVKLALLFFSTIFFLHNERIVAKNEKRRVRVILEYDDLNNHPKSKEYFGIQWLLDIPSTVIDGAYSHQLTLQRSCYSENVSTGSMSNLECLLISTIIQYAYPDVEDWTDVDLIDADFVAKNFDTIQKIANSLGMQLPLYK